MRTAFVLVSLACLFIGLSIGLISRGERLEDLPQRTVEIARGGTPSDASAASSTPRMPSPRATRPTTFAGGAVRVAGVSAQQELSYPGEYGSSLPFFGTQSLTRVALEIDLAKHAEASGLRIISLVADASTVTRFTDDFDTELTLEDSFGGPYEMNTQLSENGLGLTVFVGSLSRTHPQATRLIVEGSLAVFCANDKGTLTSDAAPMTAGSTFAVDGYEFELVSTEAVEANEWEGAKWNIELKTKGSLDAVISWSLVDADGAVTPLSESMTWTMGDVVTKTLSAPQEFTSARLRLEVWVDGKVLQVPYSLSNGIGMQ